MFAGLNEEAFLTYEEKKWSSNVHNLARMQVKGQLETLAKDLSGSLGADLDSLALGASDEIPNITNQKKVDAQWLYWFRNTNERQELKSFLNDNTLSSPNFFNIAAQDKHAILTFVLREHNLWVGLRIAGSAMVDRQNLSEKFSKTWEREVFLDLLKGAEAGLEIGFRDAAQELSDIGDGELEAMANQLLESKSSWLLGCSISREEVILQGAELKSTLAKTLKQLIPFYKYCTWSKDNDFIGAQKQIQEEKAEKRRQADSYSVGDRVRISSGLFSGKQGLVESIDTKSNIRVQVGNMSVVVPGTELIPVAK